MGSAEPKSQPKYRFGEFTLDPGRGTLLNADQEVKLRPKVYDAPFIFWKIAAGSSPRKN
jgi:hypothetical protein